VSLLLDALKRAEQEKLTRQVDRPAPAAEPPARSPSQAQASASVLELQPIASASAETSAARTDAQAAQTVFKAKTATAAKPDRRILWAAGAAAVIVLLAVGAYVWHSLNALAPRRSAVAAIRPAIVPPPAPAAQPGASAPPPASSAAVASTAPASGAGATPADSAPAQGEPKARKAIDRLLDEAQPPAEPPVQFARSEAPRPRVSPDVESGYRALLAGDLDAARRHYAAAVEADSTNVDAQLGLATADARLGNVAGAAAAYRRVLDLDPHNATAMAGLAALADTTRPEALENALRGDIAQHPDSAALELTLGNLYASQRRWAEAQAAYFEAQRLQPENADVAYNLAVSLDHLGQRRAAAEFYRRALEARGNGGAQFDAAAASRRLAQLSR